MFTFLLWLGKDYFKQKTFVYFQWVIFSIIFGATNIHGCTKAWTGIRETLGFPGSSAVKICSAWDPGLIPGLGRSPGKVIGYLFQYSWAILVAQMVKNPSAMRETWVWSLGWVDPLEEGMTTHFSILAWRFPMDRGAWGAIVHRVAKSQTHLSD